MNARYLGIWPSSAREIANVDCGVTIMQCVYLVDMAIILASWTTSCGQVLCTNRWSIAEGRAALSEGNFRTFLHTICVMTPFGWDGLCVLSK